MKKWLVAYVRLHHEKKTAERLTAMSIENFLPIQEEIRQWTYRKKKIERVVIPMMIFVHVNAGERSLVLTLSAVSRYMVLHGEHTPAVIPDEQMERFKFMLDYSEEAVEICAAPLSPGEWVRVVKGPLAGFEGELVEMNEKTKVVVRLEMLGCAGVDMPAGFVEKTRLFHLKNRRILKIRLILSRKSGKFAHSDAEAPLSVFLFHRYLFLRGEEYFIGSPPRFLLRKNNHYFADIQHFTSIYIKKETSFFSRRQHYGMGG